MKSLSSFLKLNYFTISLITFILLLCICDISSIRNFNKSKNNSHNHKRFENSQFSHSLIFTKTKLEVPFDLLYRSSSNYGDSSKKLVEQKKLEIEWTQDAQSPLTSNVGNNNDNKKTKQ